MEQDELSRLREEAARILKDVRAGTHPQDIRDAGQALNGKWDQDFPTALLKLVVDDGNTITALRNALSCAGDSLTRAHVENAELREALIEWQRAEKGITGVEDVAAHCRLNDARGRTELALSSASPSPILAEIARLREAVGETLDKFEALPVWHPARDAPLGLAKLATVLASTSETTLDRKDGK